ncbi:uncharacterized protein LOC119387261 [Rhipicephalus sanguineus]|uniref:uncharacterized protein LOC119387261 n=1 Tax=Rhipicephalus sanguineus TaxID=34632 RepID=UPI0018943EE3|nr:uncharacterized protein LOC119387261 [Rhipicephalus sanguineus]
MTENAGIARPADEKPGGGHQPTPASLDDRSAGARTEAAWHSRNRKQRSRSRVAVLRATAETRPRHDGSQGQQPGSPDGRPCTRHPRNPHRRHCHLTHSLVSTGQHQPRHIFLVEATPAEGHAFTLTRRCSGRSCPEEARRGRLGEDEELDAANHTADTTASPKLKLPQTAFCGPLAVVTSGCLHPVTAARDCAKNSVRPVAARDGRAFDIQ